MNKLKYLILLLLFITTAAYAVPKEIDWDDLIPWTAVFSPGEVKFNKSLTDKEIIYTIIHSSKIINNNNNLTIKLDEYVPNLERLNELQKCHPGRDFNGWSKTFDICDSQSIIDVFARLSNNILSKHLLVYRLPFIYTEVYIFALIKM